MLERNWFLTARWDHPISYLSSHPPRFRPIRSQPPDNTWYFECTSVIQVYYHNSSSQKCVSLWWFFLHSDCWYLVEKEHVRRDILLCERRGYNSWTVSLQIQTFRNSLTESQEKKVMTASAFGNPQGRAVRMVQRSLPSSSLFHQDLMPLAFQGWTACTMRCRHPPAGIQDSNGPVQRPRQ